MLNRRILRVKAMQSLYSYFTVGESLKNMIREQLEQKFSLDGLAFADGKEIASSLYMDHLNNRQPEKEGEVDKNIIKEVNLALAKYHAELQKEAVAVKNRMTGDVDGIQKLYLKLLRLPVELAHVEEQDKDKRSNAHIKKDDRWNWNLTINPAVGALAKFETFTTELSNRKISWAGEWNQVKIWYKEIIRKDEGFRAYQSQESPSTEEHKEVLLHFFKKIVFKNESVNDFLSKSDLHWGENKSILRSLVVKTIQDYGPGLDPPYELREVSKNGLEDLEFFKILFSETVKNSEELDKLIEKKIKNWDFSRVALIDKIILKMAVTEMTKFYSIPVKVTINEFIEVSKNYSTPKSKQFVNGILDVLANELTSNGVIKKSGRGLLDNK